MHWRVTCELRRDPIATKSDMYTDKLVQSNISSSPFSSSALTVICELQGDPIATNSNMYTTKLVHPSNWSSSLFSSSALTVRVSFFDKASPSTMKICGDTCSITWPNFLKIYKLTRGEKQKETQRSKMKEKRLGPRATNPLLNHYIVAKWSKILLQQVVFCYKK